MLSDLSGAVQTQKHASEKYAEHPMRLVFQTVRDGEHRNPVDALAMSSWPLELVVSPLQRPPLWHDAAHALDRQKNRVGQPCLNGSAKTTLEPDRELAAVSDHVRFWGRMDQSEENGDGR